MAALSVVLAVNPYLGQAQGSLEIAGARMAEVLVAQARAHLVGRIGSGQISDADLPDILSDAPGEVPATLNALKKAMRAVLVSTVALPTATSWRRMFQAPMTGFVA